MSAVCVSDLASDPNMSIKLSLNTNKWISLEKC